MRARECIGVGLVLAPFCAFGAHLAFAEEWSQLRFEPAFRWTIEEPGLYVGLWAFVLLTGMLLLRRSASRIACGERALPALAVTAVRSLLVLALFLVGVGAVFLIATEIRFRVEVLSDPGPHDGVALILYGADTRLSGNMFIKRRGEQRYEHAGGVPDVNCRWPYRIARTPGKPRYVFLDADGREVWICDLGPE